MGITTSTGEPLRLLHLAGSPTSDFYADVSRLYATDCLAALGRVEGYEHVVVWVGPDRCWRFPADLTPAAIAAAEPLQLSEALRAITALDVDVMVPQMFCRAGMTHYRALFDVLGIPYPGNRPDVMAIGADKARTKALVAAAGVAVPFGRVVRPGDPIDIDLPSVVKPIDADNSLGLSLVRRRRDFAAAVERACEHAGPSGAALVETYVELGREVRCAVLDLGEGDAPDGGLLCLPLEEYAVDARTKPVRGQDDKLARTPAPDRPGDPGELGLVAKDAEHAWIVAGDDPIVPAVHAAARAAYDALGCRSYGLFDFRIDPEGKPWLLEASLYCSYAASSVIAVMAAAADIDVPELFAMGIEPLLTTRGPS